MKELIGVPTKGKAFMLAILPLAASLLGIQEQKTQVWLYDLSRETQINVVLNRFEELKRRVPPGTK